VGIEILPAHKQQTASPYSGIKLTGKTSRLYECLSSHLKRNYSNNFTGKSPGNGSTVTVVEADVAGQPFAVKQ